MYEIWIKNVKATNGNVETVNVSDWLLYGIPITDEQADSFSTLTDPSVKLEMGKTGSMEFGLPPVHPCYNTLMQMRTIMRVVYDGTNIFRGRVLTIDTSPMTGERKVHLEGDLAFLMDSVQEGIREVDRPSTDILTYLTSVITKHNQQMREQTNPDGSTNEDKCFTLGEVPGRYSASIHAEQKITVSEQKKFGSDGWETTMSALEALEKEYGGYFRTRYVNGVTYLDWLEYCFQYDENGQPIEVGENLIDISGSTEVDNLFTAVIPIGNNNSEKVFIDGYREDIHGANKRILVPQIVSLFQDAELNKGYHSKADYEQAVNNYGIIYKTQEFQNADTKEKLWQYAIDWIKNNYVGGVTSFSLTALDMHHVDGTVAKYLLGDRVPVIYPDISRHAGANTPTITKVLTITSVQYSLHNPEKNQYNLGIPSSILNKTYGIAKSSEKGASSVGKSGSGAIGAASGGISHSNYEEEIRRRNLEQEAANHIISASFNNKDWKAIEEKDPERAASIIKSSEVKLVKYIDTLDSDVTVKDQDGKDVVIPAHTKGFLTSMVLDGAHSVLKLMDPVVKLMDGVEIKDGQSVNYDGYYDTEVGSGMILDGYNRTLEVRDIPNWRQTASQAWDAITTTFSGFIPGSTLKITHQNSTAEGQGGSSKIQTGIPLLDNVGSAIGEKVTSTTNGGSGLFASIKSAFGLDGTGDKATIEQDGENALTSIFDLSTVGIPGVTPVKTVEQDGRNGGSMAAGSGGALDGWKITLNKPLTYHYTPAGGEQQTFTVPAGSVAADDMHFTKQYDSVRAELAVFDAMYADYAQIGTLVAMNASITELQTDHVTTKSFNAVKGTVETISADYLSSTNISTKDLNFKTLTSARGSVSALSISGSGGVTSRAHELLIYDAEVSSDGKTLTLKRTLGGNVTFNKAVTLSAEYGGSGVTATYTVTADDQTSVGSFTLKLDKDKAWIEDENGKTRATLNNTYAGDVATARQEGYKKGWNECLDNCSGEYYLTNYTNYNNGKEVALYVAPTGGAGMATGSKQVWRYGGSRVYRYGIPKHMT